MKYTTLLTLSILFAGSIFFIKYSLREPVTVALPKLLERAEKIQMGKEWDAVQNAFAAQRNTLAMHPTNVESYLNLAAIYIREARVTGEHGHYYPAALKMTDQILNSETSSPDLRFRALVIKAGVQLSLHDFDAARRTGQEALDINANNAQVYGVLVDAHVELGEYDEAVRLADKMINIKPDLRSYARISYLREIHGDITGALEALQLAIDAGVPGYEERSWAMHTLGELLLKYGRMDEAKNVFEAILTERENYPFAIAALGAIAKDQQNFFEAETKLKEAISIIPEVGYYVELADLYNKTNRRKEMINMIKEILPMLKDDETNGHNMNLEYAHLYLDILQDPAKAKHYANLEYAKRPKNIDINKLLASIAIAQKDYERAKEHLKVAGSTNSQDPTIKKLLVASEATSLSNVIY